MRLSSTCGAASVSLAALMFVGCAAEPESPYAYSVQGAALGTSYTVRIADRDQPGRETELRELVQTTLDGIDARMSTYQAESEVSLLNDAGIEQATTLSPDTFSVLAAALALSTDSGGAFDPTVGALVNAWGFGPVNPDTAPSRAEIDALKEHMGVAKIRLDTESRTASRLDELLRVDLSAIAKGYAVDAVAAALQRAGFVNLMVEIGGEVTTRGTRDGEPWRIGIERPDAGAQHIQRLVPLTDRALATSGNYRNFYVMDGRTVGHTIDPRTGEPVDHNGASVSVVHAECMMADALATTLMVMGPDEGLAWAQERGIAALFIVFENDTFVERSTPEFDAVAGGDLAALE